MMKKSLAAAIFILILSTAGTAAQVFGDGKGDFKLSAGPEIEYTTGALFEQIYYSSPYENHKISELKWQRKLWLSGGSVNCQYKDFHIETEILNSIPGRKSGIMTDSDWLNTNNFDMKTTYSVGDNKVVENFNANISVFQDFKLNNYFSISPVLSGEYFFDSFSRNRYDTEGWYGQSDESSDGENHWWYEEEARHYPTEQYWSEEKQRYVRLWLDSIDYERHSFFLWTGFKARLNSENFACDFSFLFNPFCYFSASDTHQAGDYEKIFHQIQQDYLKYFKIYFRQEYFIKGYISIFTSEQVLFGTAIKGDLYSEWKLNKYQKSGAMSSSFDIKFGTKIILF